MYLTEIAGVRLADLAKQFGTPVYVYDRATIERRIADLKSFPVIRYAQKACSNIAILALMRKHGVKVDAVSAGEIHRAQAAGYTPEDIVYTADIFDHPALAVVERLNIPVNCGSPDMIEQLGTRCPGRSITLRINPGFGHGHSQKTNTGGEQSKHGIWHEQLPDCLSQAKRVGLKVTGIHMHIGSGTDFKHLATVGAALTKSALAVGKDLEMVSTGGGLPVPYRPTDESLDAAAFCELWQRTWRELQERVGRPLRLEVEPGRYLVAEAGYLVAEIRAVKEMGNNTFYLLNAGFHTLARAAMYGAYHPMSLCPVGDPSDGNPRPVVVGGPLCESGDIFTQRDGGYVDSRDLPRANVGDLLVLHCAGAYGFAMSSNYNSFPFVAEVPISGGKSLLVRERQTVEDLTRLERIPSLD